MVTRELANLQIKNTSLTDGGWHKVMWQVRLWLCLVSNSSCFARNIVGCTRSHVVNICLAGSMWSRYGLMLVGLFNAFIVFVVICNTFSPWFFLFIGLDHHGHRLYICHCVCLMFFWKLFCFPFFWSPHLCISWASFSRLERELSFSVLCIWRWVQIKCNCSSC